METCISALKYQIWDKEFWMVFHCPFKLLLPSSSFRSYTLQPQHKSKYIGRRYFRAQPSDSAWQTDISVLFRWKVQEQLCSPEAGKPCFKLCHQEIATHAPFISKPGAQRFSKRSYLFKTVPRNTFTGVEKQLGEYSQGWGLMQESSTKRATQLRSLLALLPQAKALTLEEDFLYWVKDEEAKAL